MRRVPYPHALDAIRARGGWAVPVALTPDGGWDLDLLTAAVRDAAPRPTYLVPDFHNPTGALMDPETRAGLVALARRTGTPLVLDETLVELPHHRLDPERAPRRAHDGPRSPSWADSTSSSRTGGRPARPAD
ncbi:aminotransferase class I/II-fold pyridoxal phosphate-dependent enzyme [Pseudonocardia asaccharolytica]|uniref:Aminotransferase class I/classII large domain-containing protein n=1 Tax=Pseudonocardia asaccharolytica DSM 44247 = NBRC 16224 TaxID=1123024 RepID=A0A511CV24_9PSEU|nr:aminotransferase class I/II-fold pyridoxal phosphate-dependent enzyme [Pseudonocardia asaccharolytica]GEL16297.1 hypothetical protein PA7_01340 [Pseudonocardia asaccharolytica DSM 44247 = NBRC 16224]